jgi:hypothetical protein
MAWRNASHFLMAGKVLIHRETPVVQSLVTVVMVAGVLQGRTKISALTFKLVQRALMRGPGTSPVVMPSS